MLPFSPHFASRFCLPLADFYKTFYTYMPAFENLQWILLVSRQTFSNILLLKYIDLNQILDIQDLIKTVIRVLIFRLEYRQLPHDTICIMIY